MLNRLSKNVMHNVSIVFCTSVNILVSFVCCIGNQHTTHWKSKVKIGHNLKSE